MSVVDFTSSANLPDSRRPTAAAVDIASARSAQEIQAMVIMAKKFPRDQERAYANIIQACKRKKLAETSQYSYPRGDQTVTGPSIRLAEVLAQNWGNIDFGIVELEQSDGDSQVMAYCWDLETNTRQTKVFTVPHVRQTKRGPYRLSDPRDIYELVANQGARRLRACILGVIPGDIVEGAIEACNQTLLGADKSVPIATRTREMLALFEAIGVTKEMIESRMRHKVETISETELVEYRRIYNTLRDGMQSPDKFFDTGTSNGRTQTATEFASSLDAPDDRRPFTPETANAGSVTPSLPMRDQHVTDAPPKDSGNDAGVTGLFGEDSQVADVDPDVMDAIQAKLETLGWTGARLKSLLKRFGASSVESLEQAKALEFYAYLDSQLKEGADQ